jgi:hypothetical protein
MGETANNELLTLNEIYKQLRKDALSIAQDLLLAIRRWEKFYNVVAMYGVIIFVIGLYFITITSMVLTAVASIIIGVGSIFYAYLSRKEYETIKSKYGKLIEIEKTLRQRGP